MSQLDEKCRCCRRKPLIYKRPPHKFCFKCDRFDPETGAQIENWAWKKEGATFIKIMI
jgi:hypothetical protein